MEQHSLHTLTTKAWTLRQQGLMSRHEHDLYNYLLYMCIQAKVFTVRQSTDVLCAVLGINANALTDRRARLQQLGLITFAAGRGRAYPPRYKVLDLVYISKQHVGRQQVDSDFVPPTMSEVEAYCKQRESVIDPCRFYSYYHARNWYAGVSQMRNWQSALHTWELNEPQRRSAATAHINTKKYESF